MIGVAGGLLVVGTGRVSGLGRRAARRIGAWRGGDLWFGFLGGLVLGGLVVGLGWWTALAFLGALVVGQLVSDGIDRRRVTRWNVSS